MNDNFTYHPCNFNAVTEEHNIFLSCKDTILPSLLQLTVLEALL